MPEELRCSSSSAGTETTASSHCRWNAAERQAPCRLSEHPRKPGTALSPSLLAAAESHFRCRMASLPCEGTREKRLHLPACSGNAGRGDPDEDSTDRG